jgi:hypothetical protein
MGGQAEVRGLATVISNMEAIPDRVRSHLAESAAFAGETLEKAVKDKASLECHDLSDLAELGHPYSTRFPTDSFEHPDEFVHIQSGQLIANIEKIVAIQGDKVTIACGVSEAKVPYIGYLIDGTWKMRSRDFLGWAFQETVETIVRIVKYGIVKGLGSRGGRQ